MPYDAKYIYFDYNIARAVNTDRQSSGEFGGYGNIVYAGIKPDGITEWDYIWEDSSAYIDESMVALPKDVTIHGNNTVNAYDNTYGNVYMSGWRIGCIDVSAYAGQVIEFNINISNYAYEDINLSKLLIDNVRLSSVDMENDSSVNVQYQVVSSENLPENIRELEIDDEGISHVIYTHIFEDEYEYSPGIKGLYEICVYPAQRQASYARLKLMYTHCYASMTQVYMKCVETEQDFLNYWAIMEANPNTGIIDEVVLLMHGKYYALIINSEAKQNITISPEGRVGSDDSALRVSDLPVRDIDIIRINACNAGLLDAINLDRYNPFYEKNINGEDVVAGYYRIHGNVAQAFLENQNVNIVYAWDGNLTPRGLLKASQGLDDGLSGDDSQEEFRTALRIFREAESLGRPRWVVPGRLYIDNNPQPVGLVTYVKNGAGMYCMYKCNNEANVYNGYINMEDALQNYFVSN